MKQLIFIVAFMATITCYAQVTGISIQASGLTCSMCSNAIRKSLQSVEYIDQVKANIKQSSFDITFKPGVAVDFDLLKKKVEDAGFFVASFRVNLNVNGLEVKNDRHAVLLGYNFHFLKVKDQKLSGPQSFRVLDKGFLPAKEYKKNQSLTEKACYLSGYAGPCCSIDQVPSGGRVYHVTI
ncbi:MAG: heavy-metal-associated domain-containing protein [Ferruginibacter sp.]